MELVTWVLSFIFFCYLTGEKCVHVTCWECVSYKLHRRKSNLDKCHEIGGHSNRERETASNNVAISHYVIVAVHEMAIKAPNTFSFSGLLLPLHNDKKQEAQILDSLSYLSILVSFCLHHVMVLSIPNLLKGMLHSLMVLKRPNLSTVMPEKPCCIKIKPHTEKLPTGLLHFFCTSYLSQDPSTSAAFFIVQSFMRNLFASQIKAATVSHSIPVYLQYPMMYHNNFHKCADITTKYNKISVIETISFDVSHLLNGHQI